MAWSKLTLIITYAAYASFGPANVPHLHTYVCICMYFKYTSTALYVDTDCKLLSIIIMR